MAKKLKWNLILMSLLYLALGIFLLMVPRHGPQRGLLRAGRRGAGLRGSAAGGGILS